MNIEEERQVLKNQVTMLRILQVLLERQSSETELERITKQCYNYTIKLLRPEDQRIFKAMGL